MSTHRILKAGLSPIGYYVVSLWKNNKGKTYTIHRLLAEHFIENPENKPTINHIDGDKTNNSISNLEWATYGENNKHAYDEHLKVVTDKMRKSTGERASKMLKNRAIPIRSRAVIQYDLNMNKIAEYISVEDASKKSGLAPNTIHKNLKGKIIKPTKYIWKYKEEVKNG